MNTPLPTQTEYLGTEGEDPTAPFWASGNYVGPYWSNGEIQESVEWGDKDPVHALDELARQHDAAYAHYKDEKHREAADMIFAEEAKKLKQKYGSKWADDPQIAARFVEYGNHLTRQVKSLASIGVLGPAALPLLIYHQAKNMIDNQKRINGTYLTKEMGDIRKLYENDPRLRSQVIEAVATGASGKRPAWSEPTIDLVPRSDTSQADEASWRSKVPTARSGPIPVLNPISLSTKDQRRYSKISKALNGVTLASDMNKTSKGKYQVVPAKHKKRKKKTVRPAYNGGGRRKRK